MKRKIRTYQLDLEKVVQRVNVRIPIHIIGLIDRTILIEEYGTTEDSRRAICITQHCDNAELDTDETYVGSYKGKIGNLVHVYVASGATR